MSNFYYEMELQKQQALMETRKLAQNSDKKKGAKGKKKENKKKDTEQEK